MSDERTPPLGPSAPGSQPPRPSDTWRTIWLIVMVAIILALAFFMHNQVVSRP